jgi:C4-dicarboxylate-specific signal transduction histidine kinase
VKTSPTVSNSNLATLLHELNQPLTAILSNAQAAQRFLSNSTADHRAEMRDILADIVADNKRAAAIVQQLRQACKDANGVQR